MEDVIEKVNTKEHKGTYGNTNGKSANAIYNSYRTHILDNGKTPMSFNDWIKWAKQKGVVSGNYSSDAVMDDKQEDVAPPVKSSMKKYVGVAFVVVSVIVLYKAFKSEDKK